MTTHGKPAGAGEKTESHEAAAHPPPPRWMGPLVAGVVLLICLGVAEVGLRIMAPFPDPFVRQKTPAGSVWTNPFIRSEFPPDFSMETEAEPGLPGVSGQNLFSTNNMGFRGQDLVQPKPPDEFRVFLVGGSTTENLYLDDSDALTAVLQRELQTRVSPEMAVRVYGAGKSGDRSDDHISMLVHRIVHLEPDLVVVFAGFNDFRAAMAGFDYLHFNPRPWVAMEDSPELLQARHLIKLLLTELQLGRRAYALVNRAVPEDPNVVLQMLAGRSNYRALVEIQESAPRTDAAPRTDLEPYRRNLQTLAGVAQSQELPLVFMTQATTWNSQVDPGVVEWQWLLYGVNATHRADLMDEAMEAYNDVTREVAAESAVPLFDLARLMPKSLDYFYDDVHFNVEGARVAGVALADFLVQTGSVPTTGR